MPSIGLLVVSSAVVLLYRRSFYSLELAAIHVVLHTRPLAGFKWVRSQLSCRGRSFMKRQRGKSWSPASPSIYCSLVVREARESANRPTSSETCHQPTSRSSCFRRCPTHSLTCLVEMRTLSTFSKQSLSGFVAFPPDEPAPKCITSLTSKPFTSDMSIPFATEGSGSPTAATDASKATAPPSKKPRRLLLLPLPSSSRAVIDKHVGLDADRCWW